MDPDLGTLIFMTLDGKIRIRDNWTTADNRISKEVKKKYTERNAGQEIQGQERTTHGKSLQKLQELII